MAKQHVSFTLNGKNVDALVIECMAIRPDLQRVCEHGIVHATHGVITNVRPDHLDVMGPTVQDAALAMAGTAPSKGKLITSETDPELLALLRIVCERKGSELVAVTPESDHNAGVLIDDAKKTIGGGGKPADDISVAGGKDAAALDDALDQARAAAGIA